MRRTLAIVAVVLGFGAAAVVAVAMIRPPVTRTVPLPIPPTPAQLEGLQAEIQTVLLAEDVDGGWVIGVEGDAVRVVLPPEAEPVGHRLQDRYGALVQVSYAELSGPAVTMLPPLGR